MPALIHRLTHASLLQGTQIVCGAFDAAVATWDAARVTCPACRETGLPAPSRGQKQAPTPNLTEAAWLQQVRTLARTRGFLTYHPLRSQGSEGGWMDLVLVKPPVLWAVELKTATGRLTPAQQQWLTALAEVQEIRVQVWRPDDWPQIVEMLQ